MPTRSWIVSRTGSGRLGQVRLAGRLEGHTGLRPGTVRRYPAYGLTFVTAGTGRYRDAGTEAEVRPGTMVLVLPGVPHWYGTLDGTWDESFLMFDGPVFDLARRQGVLSPGRPLVHGLPVTRWQRRLDAFRTRRRPTTEAGRDAEALDLLALLTEAVARGGTAAADDWLARSLTLLEGDLEERLPLAQVADEVGIPYETWRRRFRELTGTSPHQHRLGHRLDTAAELLTGTALSTREIAAALGFSDERHLIRRFRARTGVTPRRWRDDGQTSSRPR